MAVLISIFLNILEHKLRIVYIFCFIQKKVLNWSAITFLPKNRNGMEYLSKNLHAHIQVKGRLNYSLLIPNLEWGSL